MAAPVAALCLCAGVAAEPLPFRATMTVLLGTSPAAPLQPTAPVSGTGFAHYTPTAFTLPSGAIATDRFTPVATTVGGPIPLPTVPTSAFIIGQVLNQTSGGGSFAAGPEPAPSLSGTLRSGATLDLLIGVTPFGSSMVFGSARVPLPVGITTTVVEQRFILGNAVTVTAFAEGWTTGRIRYDDRSRGTLHPQTGQPLDNPTITSGTVRGSRELGPDGGSITLVTPVVVRVPNTLPNLLAGYARLQIVFGERALVPEASSILLLGSAAFLLGLGRARRSRPG